MKPPIDAFSDVAESFAEDLPGSVPWVGTTFGRAMSRAMFGGLILVHVILLAAALVSGISASAFIAALSVGVVAAGGVAVLLWHVSSLVLSVPFFVGLAFYYVVALDPNDPLVGALIPLTAWTVVLPIVLRPGRWPVVVSVLLSFLYAGVILVAHPEWDGSVVYVSATTNIVLVALVIVFMHFLRRVAGSTDRYEQMAARQELSTARERALSDATAEYIRVLHDTIINTFLALARDQSHQISEEEVRARCQRDMNQISAFRSHHAGRTRSPSLTDLDSVGLPIQWSGIRGDDLRRSQTLLPPRVVRALHGCAVEAILNATKHSGADHVVCDVQLVNDVFRLDILDDGVGFDPEIVPWRGVASSLIERARAHAIHVSLVSAPGEGTRVRLEYSLKRSRSAIHEIDGGGETAPLRYFELRMAMAWVALSTSAGFLIELFRYGGGSIPAYLLLTILTMLGTTVWLRCRGLRRTPAWLKVMLVSAVPIVNWCALESVDFGQSAPYLFAAMPMTVIPVLLYVISPTPHPFVVALTIYIMSSLVLAFVAAEASAVNWWDIVLIQTPSLAQIAAHVMFYRGFRSSGRELASARQKLQRTRHESAVLEAVAEVQMQWSASTLQAPFRLLQELADGVVSVMDPDTRRRCELEENYLRQVSAIPFDLPFLSWWLVRATAEARQRSVKLKLFAEQPGINEPDLADAFGRLLIDCIDSSPSNAELVVYIDDRGGSTRMMLIGANTGSLTMQVQRHRSELLDVRFEDLDDRVIVEAAVRIARNDNSAKV